MFEERVSISVAASELCMDALTLRGLMQQGKINLGYAIKRDGCKRWTYLIYRKRLDEAKQELGIGGGGNDK